MKKRIPHIIILLVLAAAVVLFITDKNKAKQKLDERITFQKKDKIPYGMYVAYENLKYLFPKATVYESHNEPGYWDSLSIYGSKQALIIITPQFYADEFEMKKLVAFVENGNDVFISTRIVSDAAEDFINCRSSVFGTTDFVTSDGEVPDSLTVSLSTPPFASANSYSYPGKKFSAWFYQTDSASVEKLGGDEMDRNNFIHLRAGTGNLYFHLAPMAFSNYFLLHENNIRYYEQALSLINPGVTKIGWDEYYLNKVYSDEYSNRQRQRSDWLNVLFQYPGLKAALLTAMFALLLYVLMEARRKQRYIPVITKPKNDSLDFVKTIGRLYHDKGDHKNLCLKMSAYFLEYIRNRYKMATGKLDEDFVKNLQYKTGCEEQEIQDIVSFIKYLETAPSVNDAQLVTFHKQLESFYKKA